MDGVVIGKSSTYTVAWCGCVGVCVQLSRLEMGKTGAPKKKPDAVEEPPPNTTYKVNEPLTPSPLTRLPPLQLCSWSLAL